MRLVAFTFLPSGLVSTATYLLRSAGNVRIPLIGSSIAFFLNLFFNWVFIFGKLGAPRLELVGAAVGTLIARGFEFCFVFGYFILKDTDFGFRIRHILQSGRQLNRQYFQYSIPVLVSDTILGLSLMLTSGDFGTHRRGDFRRQCHCQLGSTGAYSTEHGNGWGFCRGDWQYHRNGRYPTG